MRPSVHRAGRAFSLALHGTLALELGRLAASGAAFEDLWRKPRRTGLKVAVKALGLGLLAAAAAARQPPARA